MTWRLSTTKVFDRKFKKLDRYTQKMLQGWILNTLLTSENPRAHGKALSGPLVGYWRYRIGDYRLIVKIKDEELVVVAVAVGHRREVYRSRKTHP